MTDEWIREIPTNSLLRRALGFVLVVLVAAVGLALLPFVASGSRLQTFIYWANEGAPSGKPGNLRTGTTIGRSSLDGKAVDESFISGAHGPCGVAVAGSHIYWANQGSLDGTIGRANLDGTAVAERFIGGVGLMPCVAAADRAHIYWTSFLGGCGDAIGRAKLDGTGANQYFISDETKPGHCNVPAFGTCGVAIGGSHIYWGSDTTVGKLASIARANLDGTGIDRAFIRPGVGPVCVLTVDNQHIYWTSQHGTIAHANLDGTGVTQTSAARLSLPRGYVQPCGGVAIDRTDIYWAAGATTIGRANLGVSAAANNNFITGANVPCGVAVG